MNERTTDHEFIETFANRFERVRWKPGGQGFMASCAVDSHEDRNPSLSVDTGDDGSLLLFCHGGCETEDVLDAIGLTWADLQPPAEPLAAYVPVTGRTAWTADELLSTTLPEPRWAVPGLLPAGLSVLAGAPKIGKSWLLLDICLRVAMGGRVLGVCEVEPGPTLYLALEDTPRRLQERARRLLGPVPGPATAHLHTSWPRMGDGGADLLRDHLAAHPDTRVVAVDVLSRIRDVSKGNQQQYEADYEAMTEFKEIADTYGVALLVNHHDRKAKDADWLSVVSGTRGVTGAADAVMLLRKERSKADGVLSITGRDVEESERALKFEAGQWTLLDGPVELYTVSATRARILGLLRESPNLRPAEVADRLEGVSRDNAKQTLSRMREAGQVQADGDGRYRLADLGDCPKGVTTVTESPPRDFRTVTGDGSDRSSRVTRRPHRGESQPLILRRVTGCSVEEWMAGIEKGYAYGLMPDAPDRLADYCDECTEDRLHHPQAITSNGHQMTTYYVCPAGHAWLASHADLDYLWRKESA